MDKKKLTALVTRRLAKEYPEVHVTLDRHTPFQLVVSVILSAQATDKKVNEVMAPHYKTYKTARDFAALTQKQLEQMVRPLGFYHMKARAVRETALRVCDTYDNRVPLDFDALLTLRGIARKSANVIYGELTGTVKGVVVDTHVTRLAHRLGLSKKKNAVQIERDLMNIVPEKDWRMFPHYLVWHGRAVCKAQRPACDACSLNTFCPSAFQLKPWKKKNPAKRNPTLPGNKAIKR
ncbi:MAG: endonuclease III [Patescibacteria group bacterium]